MLAVGVNRSVLRPGQKVAVEVYAENRGARSAFYVVGAVGYPAPAVWLEGGKFGRVELMEPENRGRAWAEAEEMRELRPGERITRRLSWDQKVLLTGTAAQAPPGVYPIRATFAIGVAHGGGTDTFRLEAAVNVVVGQGRSQGKNIARIGPDEAEAIARHHPKVVRWLEERQTLLPLL